MRRLLLAFLVLALLGALAVPAGSVPERRTAATAKPQPSTTTTTWPALPAFDAAVAWSDCGDGFECGTLNVPVDWKPQPASEKMGLALVRHPATSPAERIGSLVVNYGGPGESGVDYLRLTWGRLPAVVQARFDVVSFDPRGSGASRPIDCVDDAFLDLSAGVAAIREHGRAARHRPPLQLAVRRGLRRAHGRVRRAGRDPERRARRRGDPARARRTEARLPRVLVRHHRRRHVRADVPDHHPQHGARRPTRLLALRARLHVPAGARVHERAERVPRVVPADLLLADVGRRAARRAAAAHRPRRPTAAPGVVHHFDGVTREGVLTPSLLQSGVFAMLYDRSRGLADPRRRAHRSGATG